jgi:hypothetical protein
MKRISLALDETTYDLILETIMESFPSDVLLCDKCGKVFSIEADEGSVSEEGAFCNKHLPKEAEE